MCRRRPAWLIVVLTLGCTRGDRPRQFVARMQTRIAATHSRLQILGATPDELTLRRADGTNVTANLDALRAACERDEKTCDATADAFFLNLEASPGGPGAFRQENVRPVLRDKSFVDLLRSKTGAGATAHEDAAIVQPFVGDLRVTYVIDTPSSMITITSQLLRDLKVDEPELPALALKNLANALPPMRSEPLPGSARIRRLVGAADYEASRVLFHEPWKEIARSVEGDLLVVAPARDVVMYVGSARPEDVQDLRALAQGVVAKVDSPINATVLRWTESGWTRLP